MKIRFKLNHIVCIALLSPAVTNAAPNPASQDWVKTYAVPQLRASDWSSICTTGAPTNVSGCYGNISSAAFAKINQTLYGVADLFNVPISEVKNSVFIQQYNGDSGVTPNPAHFAVAVNNNSLNTAVCALYTARGANLTLAAGVNNCILSNKPTAAQAQAQALFTAICAAFGLPAADCKLAGTGGESSVTIGASSVNDSQLLFQQCTSAQASNYTPVQTPFYLLCLGRDTNGNTAPLLTNGNGITAS